MTYRSLVAFINWLVKLANAIRLLKCKKSGECLCVFCTNEKCKNRGVTINRLITPTTDLDCEEEPNEND